MQGCCLRCFPFEEGIFDYRLAKISFGVSPPDALIDSVLNASSQTEILWPISIKNYSKSAILKISAYFFCCKLGVFKDIGEGLFAMDIFSLL
jgi:hypothetical protein